MMRPCRYILLLLCVLATPTLCIHADDYLADDVYYWVAPIGATYVTAGTDSDDEADASAAGEAESEQQHDMAQPSRRSQSQPQVVFLDDNIQRTDTVVRAIIRRSK